MGFIINEIKYKSSFINAKGFTHNKGNLIKLFPFATDTTSLTESAHDFRTFKGATGEFFRVCRDLSFTKVLDKEELIGSILKDVYTEHAFELKNLLTELFFDEDNDLVLFDPEILPHLNNKSQNVKLKNLQAFISNLLIDEEVTELVSNIFTARRENNIIYKLVLEHLTHTAKGEPNTQDRSGTYEGRIALDIRQLFKDDLRQLIAFPDFFIENISVLIKYYYFQYIIRLTTQLNYMFNDDRKASPLFYSLEWEKLSRSRFCLESGWNKLEHSMEDSFVHANCLELLNTIEGNYGCFATGKPFTYEEILDTVKNMPPEGQNDLSIKVHRLIEDYMGAIQKAEKDNERFNWSNFTQQESDETKSWTEHHSLKLIDRLFQLIRYQFKNTGRRKPYAEYKLWFTNFVKSSYIKYRGSLGATLKIDRALLLLLTELSILSSKSDKIILNRLWTDFELRGLFLDHESKKEVIIFFDKINILEKKSDSGDAQYVKSLLMK
ncbi:DNA phosphorothioation-dependent restriction protein DptG [Pedobacter sp. MC2016-15]|uniref:DNA phosphorothioation-dependent restriction protein DptG n=1 Tax=Pedobacter sp. MC2016-15 TaxID=2994473 RepID=UPI002245B825|nr:DNA phosphorothioation-dependent restriction protein DptG [Pedobacter sp. MC2016-15]MCX2478373.1 DNA phosphorothioation-dependent restriction protein DptG [Pedobacter sp. MC2016-15]